MEWKPIESVPRRQAVKFRRMDGSEFTGTWAPYWCGSDCPCDVADEGLPPTDFEPDCWCAYEDGYRTGEATNPTHWMPLPPPPTSPE